MIFYLLYRLGQFIVRVFPIRWAYSLAEGIAILRYHFSIYDKKIVANNLKTVLQAKGENFDEDKIKRLTKEVYKNFAKYLVEFFRFSKIDKEFINKKVKIKGIKNLDMMLKRNKGIISLSAHLGNWELGAAVLSALGHSINGVILSHKSKAVNDLFNKQRTTKGIGIIPTGVAIKRCFQLLKDNEIIAFLGDKDFFRSGIWMRFLGKKTLIPKGPAVFSLKTQAPIVPVFLIRESDNTFKFIFENPIEPTQSRSQDNDVEILTRRIIDVIEKYIKEYPTQWLMFHKIWDF